MYIYISIIAFALLFSPATPITAIFSFVVLISIYAFRNKHAKDTQITQDNKVISATFLTILSAIFVNRWHVSSKVQLISDLIGLNEYSFLVIVAIILSVISFKYISLLISAINQPVNQVLTNQPTSYRQSLYIFIIATATISLISYSSPLYPFNIWVDPNCFFTVGKSVLDGIVPYRDLYEQKGPLLYFIHTFAALISYRSFFGVYLVEIVAAWAFLLISYKSITLFSDSKYRLLLIVILSVLTYTSPCFLNGDSAEELCLPFIAYALYVGFKTIKTGQPITRTQALTIGITAASVLWIKFSFTGFYIGWIGYLLYFYFKNKWGKKILTTFSYAIIGLIIPTIPIFIYFMYHDALGIMLQTYFYDNTMMYGNKTSSIFPLILNTITSSQYNILLFALILCGIVITKSKVRHFYLSALLSTTIFIFMRHSLPYYPLILAAFTPLGIIVFDYIIRHTRPLFHYAFIAILIIGCLFSSLYGSMIFTPVEDLAFHKFDKIMKQEENPTLLNYRFLDGGFFTYSGLIPTNRYFCKLNLNNPEMIAEQDSIAENGLTTFIVTQRYAGKPEKYTFSKYTKVAEYPLKNQRGGFVVIHSLYKLKQPSATK